MKIISGSITSPLGFKAAGIHCGIKRRKLDLGLLYSQVPAVAAGVFTTNKLYAPHIDIDKEHLKKDRIQAVLVNSGNANCYNGKRGLMDAMSLIKETSKHLKLDEKSILISSTGLIGKPLPLKKIKKKIGELIKNLKRDKSEFAQSILTTDKKAKQITVKIKIENKNVLISGCIKGAGMIHPNMATTLCFITTDANIRKRALKKALKLSVDKTLNLISVEGEMSPNDTVIVLANGLAKNKAIDLKCKSYLKFSEALTLILFKLSEMLIENAEGSTKVIRVSVQGAKTYQEAKKLAFSIANSNLIKIAAYGEDPNWGRVVSCVGSSGVNLDPEKVEISFEGVTVFRNLEPEIYNKKRLKNIFKKKKIDIVINLHIGKEGILVLTSDLTPEYIHINANYRT